VRELEDKGGERLQRVLEDAEHAAAVARIRDAMREADRQFAAGTT
jgi:hypothetical protein